jgi:hypothetical protein
VTQCRSVCWKSRFPTHWERTLGLFRSVVAFWRFLFDRGYRQRSWAAFRAADTIDRALMILYAFVSVITHRLLGMARMTRDGRTLSFEFMRVADDPAFPTASCRLPGAGPRRAAMRDTPFD